MFDKENPAIKFRNAIIFINFRVKKLCSLLKVNFFQLEASLFEKCADKYQKTGMFFQRVNNDIYGKWLAGNVQDFELRAWELALTQWRDSWIEMLRQYWHDQKNSAMPIFPELD